MFKPILETILCASVMAAAPAAAAEHVVIQKDRAFSQVAITVSPGDSIIFKNSDDITHNVFSVSQGMEFEIRRQTPGSSSTIPFEKEGVAEVRCAIHPKMKLIVTVK